MFKIVCSIHIVFSINENHPCYPNKEKFINFLFITATYFPLLIQMNIKTQYNDCYVILTTYMLDSALEPSYNLSKNLFITAKNTEIDRRYGK